MCVQEKVARMSYIVMIVIECAIKGGQKDEF